PGGAGIAAGLGPSGTRRARRRSRRLGKRRRGQRLARLLHVAVHLRYQRLGRGEAPLASQAPYELHAQLAAVQVAVEVEDEDLDQLAASGVEGRPHADADRGGQAVGEARVHAMPGTGERLIGHEVGRREAKLTPAAVALLAHAVTVEW